MEWIITEEREPKEGQVVLTTNHAYLDPANERYYVVAEFNDGDYIEPEDREIFFKPDYWCEIIGPEPPEVKP